MEQVDKFDFGALKLDDRTVHQLIIFRSTPDAVALWKLFESLCQLTTSEAMEVDPSDRVKQKVAVDRAHYYRQIYKDVRNMLDLEAELYLNEVHRLAQEAEMRERQKVEEIIFEQSTGQTTQGN